MHFYNQHNLITDFKSCPEMKGLIPDQPLQSTKNTSIKLKKKKIHFLPCNLIHDGQERVNQSIQPSVAFHIETSHLICIA